MKYSYDLYNELGRIEGKEISKERYNEIINKEWNLIQEWETEFSDYTLFGKQYKLENGYRLFIWKEVVK